MYGLGKMHFLCRLRFCYSAVIYYFAYEYSKVQFIIFAISCTGNSRPRMPPNIVSQENTKFLKKDLTEQ